jgi:hypothetical protein
VVLVIAAASVTVEGLVIVVVWATEVASGIAVDHR